MAKHVLVVGLACMCVPVSTLHSGQALLSGRQSASLLTAATKPSLPELPQDIRELGVKLFSDAGLTTLLTKTQCNLNGHLSYNLTISMCGHADDRTFFGSWVEHSNSDHYSFRRPGLDAKGVFLDAGAYIGDTGLMMHKLYPQAKVYLFEPMPRSYFYLRWNLRLNDVPEIPCQGSPKDGGVCAFSGPTGLGDGTPLEVRWVTDKAQESGSSMKDRTDLEGQKYENFMVPTISVNQLLEQNSDFKRVEFLKLDCQGCEWSWVPQAMKDGSLDKINNLNAEVHCVDDELPSLTRQDLVERKKVYDELKVRSGKYFADPNPCNEVGYNTWKSFDLDAEIQRRSGSGRLLPSWALALGLLASLVM